MKRWIFVWLILSLLFPSHWVWCKSEDKDTNPNISTGRAISLKVLQKRLKLYHTKGNYPKELLQLVGIKRIIGYVIDDANRDIILIGKVDTSLPPLHLEDFVVALRNAWLKYAKKRWFTYYYSNPGCSIDPNPKVIKRLQVLGNQIISSSYPGGIEQGIDKWHEISRSPQKVRIIGIPFHTHFSWVMVKADYDMKKLVDGSDILNIPGFTSLTDITLDRAKSDVIQGRPLSIPLCSMNRFWFYPGENRYREDKGIVMIERCPVILLTEEEYLSKRGEIVGTGQPNPFAQEFAESFSALYQKVAKQRPIYTELENLFRFVALCKIMKFKSPHKEVGLDLGYLLEDYRISKTYVKQELPGRSNVKGFEYRRDFSRGYQIIRFWLPSCGGVGIEIEVSQMDFVKDTTRRLSELRVKVLKTRPSPNILSWNFPLILER
jgi:hypothetical protein